MLFTNSNTQFISNALYPYLYDEPITKNPLGKYSELIWWDHIFLVNFICVTNFYLKRFNMSISYLFSAILIYIFNYIKLHCRTWKGYSSLEVNLEFFLRIDKQKAFYDLFIHISWYWSRGGEGRYVWSSNYRNLKKKSIKFFFSSFKN